MMATSVEKGTTAQLQNRGDWDLELKYRKLSPVSPGLVHFYKGFYKRRGLYPRPGAYTRARKSPLKQPIGQYVLHLLVFN